MADSDSMATSELVAKTLLDEHADILREAVALVVAELMEAEISAQIGAARGEVSPDRRSHRNGYRPRRWETRVGELELAIPRKRSGEAYFPSFLEPRRRSEQAIVAVVMEAYVKRRLHAQGRPARRAARHRRHDQGPGLGALPRPR